MTAASELKSIGFADENGALAASATVAIVPVGSMFFEVRITAAGGTVSTVVHASALKITRESTSLTANR